MQRNGKSLGTLIRVRFIRFTNYLTNDWLSNHLHWRSTSAQSRGWGVFQFHTSLHRTEDWSKASQDHDETIGETIVVADVITRVYNGLKILLDRSENAECNQRRAP
jgi:hypothetical protein